MSVINKQGDSSPMLRWLWLWLGTSVNPAGLFGVLLFNFVLLNGLVELDEEKGLILHVREQIVFTDEAEDPWPSQFEIVGKSLPRLSIEYVPDDMHRKSKSITCEKHRRTTNSSAMLSIRTLVPGFRSS